MKVVFWTSIFITFYTYLGYGLLLYFLILLKRIFYKRRKFIKGYELPTVTLVVAAYNEESIIAEKIRNTLEIDYPKEKVNFLFVTDGSIDKTPSIIQSFSEVTLLHASERKGKINAIHRAMNEITSDIVVFTDANTFLNRDVLHKITRHYANEKVGAVAGEKRVIVDNVSDATAGEGFYWKYESKLKKWDSELYSVVGAAGELFSIRRNLYVPVKPDTILDDFMISLLIASKGYRIVYDPDAYAIETSSSNVQEELKRKIRIAAGGIQSILRLRSILNPFRNPVLTFQYISHRVLRWTITPFAMAMAFILNILIVANDASIMYRLLLFSQLLFYIAAAIGLLLERKRIKIKALFVPFYFCMMNYAVFAGIKRYFFGHQSVQWDKAKRK